MRRPQPQVLTLVTGTFALVATLFAATTFDSASDTIASLATRYLKAGDDPARWHRVFWALALGAWPTTFTFLGGFTVPQTMVLIVSLRSWGWRRHVDLDR